uniref:Uncharacterized protein n=1 Tax=viral metagenome TaxID=1070528 RepID=A0A6M3KGZ3_9ZZZZ
MGATLTPVVYVLRAGPEHEEYGDPYEFAATVTVVDGTAYLQGAAAKMDLKTGKAIVTALKQQGIRRIKWEKKTGGTTIKRDYGIWSKK